MRAVLANFRLHRSHSKQRGSGQIVPRITGIIIAGLALAALVACQPNLAPLPAQSASLRAQSQPIYSTAALPAARLIGTWGQVAGFGADRPCVPAPRLTFVRNASGVQVVYDLCLGAQRVAGQGMLASAGAQGRYLLPEFSAPIWVLWIDEGNRTMALGTPDGSFGMIVAKSPPPPDHIRAAREILAWNGYDLTRFYQY